MELTGGDWFDSDISRDRYQHHVHHALLWLDLQDERWWHQLRGLPDPRMLALASNTVFGAGLGDFYTNVRLYENWNDTGSQDSIVWVNNTEDTLFFGETTEYRGRVPVVVRISDHHPIHGASWGYAHAG